MPRVYYSTIISAPIEQVWEFVRDFNGLPKWHPGIKASEIEGGCGPECTACVGSVRHFQLADDSWMREQLLGFSDADYSVTYTILETGMKLKNYLATLSLVPVTATDETFAEWEAVFDVTDLAAEEETIDTVYGVFSSGLENLDEMLMEEFDIDSEGECECGECSCGECCGGDE
ncbi:MAG: SRPBCC family protein [Synergistaceae bacterium]|jgi:hypothetical protein|nr:SRPBCC family protein [Synergistaceae bacterium]NCC56804.1 SRPBCC family protein [Synergistales bacterium]MDD3391472.1 SRPBCC family protein [Synergistaceae bacterium]MDD3689889.1 SRPBCC family protein [Synergistaceae bacterium]MDD4021453.1 SRPBCC family protein [Synergistaceae bacterium]